MANDRMKSIVQDLVAAVRDVLRKHDVTFDEYRAGFRYMIEVAENKEIPLLLDLFLNSTVVELEGKRGRGSRPAIEGPYFREGAPFIDGSIQCRDEDQQPPLRIQGSVKSVDGKPLSGAVVDIWHSSPEGRYSGVHANIPLEFYRGKVKVDDSGKFEVTSILPVPYQIPNQGPVGKLLEWMGRHSWRPAHVHFKVRKDGFRTLTTQVYFEGGDYLEDDCAEGVRPDLIMPENVDDGVHVVNVDFVLDRVA